MKAVVVEGPGVIELREVEPPTARPGEVLICTDLVGICATDMHIVDGTFPTARYPITPGHEATGIIMEIGDGVASLDIGDRVVIDPGLPCNTCLMCRRGRPNLCENRNALGITVSGAASELVCAPAGNCHRVPQGLQPRAAVLAEPLACVAHAFDLIEPLGGATVAIYGGGTIGLLSAAVARALGATSVCVVEIDEERRRNVESAGFTSVSDASLASSREMDLVVDATGAVRAIADGLGRLRRGGTFVQIGVAHPEATVPLSPYAFFSRELRMVGSMTTRHSFPRALDMLGSGAIPVEWIVDEPVGLDSYAAAVEALGSGRVPKVTVAPSHS